MKKMLVVLPLAMLLVTLTIGVASARYHFADPALCVAGKWLVIDAADTSAVKVLVPEDTPYGDQITGGCTSPGPDVPLVNIVKERGRGPIMLVQVDGKNASTPTVQVSYGSASFTRPNHGRGTLNFVFALPR